MHHLYVELGLPAHVVSAQMGWSLKSMLETYSHHSVGALDAIDAALDQTVTQPQAVDA